MFLVISMSSKRNPLSVHYPRFAKIRGAIAKVLQDLHISATSLVRAFSIHHMKAMYVPFQLICDDLAFSKGLQSDRPKCRGMLVDPRAFQNHTEIGLFVPSLNITQLSENFKIFVS